MRDWIHKIELEIYKKENLTYFFLILIVIGLFTIHNFRALSSIGIGGFFIFAIYNAKPSQIWSKLKENKAFLFLTAIFFIHALHVFSTSSENFPYFWERVTIKLPFLLLPIGMIAAPKLDTKRYHLLYYLYFLILSGTAISAMINYINHFEEINAAYLRSKTLPVIVNHVRYSLMIALGIFCGAWILWKKVYLIHRFEKYIVGILTIFLFAFLHLMSVRSGLVAFYIMLGLSLIYYAAQTKKYLLAFGFLAAVCVAPVICFVAIPTFQNKIENTLEDLSHLDDEYNANFHSLTGRVFSYRVGWTLFKENPILGVGIGNLRHETELQYIRDFGQIHRGKRILAHNQYLRYLTAFGAIGFLLLMFCFYYPLFNNQNYRHDYLLFLQYVVVSVSFLFEGTLETQLGCNLSLIFILLPLYHFYAQRESLSDGISKEASSTQH